MNRHGPATLAVEALSTCLVVGALGPMLDWYGRVLGLAVDRRLDMTEMGFRVALLQTPGGQTLELVEARDFVAQRRPPPPGYLHLQGFSQLSVRVADAAAAEHAARMAGLEIAWPLTRNPALGVAAFLLRDPEGNLVEVLERLRPEAAA